MRVYIKVARRAFQQHLAYRTAGLANWWADAALYQRLIGARMRAQSSIARPFSS
jgi:hypothetical protein